MKYVAIYIADIVEPSGPRFKAPVYTKSYPQLFSLIRKYGAMPLLLHKQERTYLGNGTFNEYWLPFFDENGRVTAYERHDEQITVTSLYDKARFAYDDIEVLNHKEIRDICRDKYLSYLFIPELHPATSLIENEEQLGVFIDAQGDTIVALKALDSNGGKDVYVGPAAKYGNNLEFPLIAQEFVDTSAGVPGLVDGVHDVRVALFDGEVIHGRLRTPGEGELRANIAFGGSNRALKVEEIPEELIAIAKEIDKKVATLPGAHRFYSIDFGYDGQKWRVFELNAWPGLVDTDEGEAEYDYMSTLASRLIETCATNGETEVRKV